MHNKNANTEHDFHMQKVFKHTSTWIWRHEGKLCEKLNDLKYKFELASGFQRNLFYLTIYVAPIEFLA